MIVCSLYCSRTSKVLPLDILHGPGIVLLAPNVVVPDRPDNCHAEDKSRPVEIGKVGIWGDREEHENEERALESECAAKGGSQQLRGVERLMSLRQVAEQAESVAKAET
jgi:hypothetical protein